MGNNVQIVRDGQGYMPPAIPGITITNGDFPVTPLGVGNTLEFIGRMQEPLTRIMHSLGVSQQYELAAITNQLRVAGMPEPTVLQKVFSPISQNYARERKAAERTVSESAEISRGFAKALGRDIRDVPNSQIHSVNYAATIGDLERATGNLMMQSLAYLQALTAMRIQESESYLKNSSAAFQALQPNGSRGN